MEIGKLSAKNESNGDAGAIGYDPGGGFSYGINQIETKLGTFASFMDFILVKHPAIHQALTDLGGTEAAKKGTEEFKAGWKALAKTDTANFKAAQHDFIVEKFYCLSIARLKAAKIDLTSPPRSNALADVIYSLAVMAGAGSVKANGPGACGLIFDALTSINGVATVDRIDDAKLINVIYAEKLKRIDTGKEYAKQPANIKLSVRNRMLRENADALKMLAAEKV